MDNKKKLALSETRILFVSGQIVPADNRTEPQQAITLSRIHLKPTRCHQGRNAAVHSLPLLSVQLGQPYHLSLHAQHCGVLLCECAW